MKRIFKVTILFILVILSFTIFCYAYDGTVIKQYTNFNTFKSADPRETELLSNIYDNGRKGKYIYAASDYDNALVYITGIDPQTFYVNYVVVSDVSDKYCFTSAKYNNFTSDTHSYSLNSSTKIDTYDNSKQLYYHEFTSTYFTNFPTAEINIVTDLQSALQDAYNYYNNVPEISYTKNPNVDEFLANTLISMGVKFKTSSSGISIAQAAWDYLTDEQSLEDLDRLHKEWNIDYVVSYCNAQSNNYKNWYNGYKVSKDVTLALTAFLDYNYEITGTRPNTIATIAGIEVDNFNQNYMPLDSSFDPSNISSYTFYAAQTVTYANGEYLYDDNVIDLLEFDYSPAQVRQFIGYPPSGTITIPSDPEAGTGSITDDPNNPDQKNITINFPALDWLAEAIKSILDFLRDAFTTLANLLTQLLDAILGLFSDAFEGLEEFGEGFIEFLQNVFTGFSDVLSGFVPTDIATILVTFLALNIGLGLITFVLKGH